MDDSNFSASPMLPMKRRRKDSSLEGCEPVSSQMKVRQSCKLRELGNLCYLPDSAHSTRKPMPLGSRAAPPGPYSRVAIKRPASRHRQSIAIWPRCSFRRSPDRKFANTLRKSRRARGARADGTDNVVRPETGLIGLSHLQSLPSWGAKKAPFCDDHHIGNQAPSLPFSRPQNRQGPVFS
jgi:hypothetical protein